MTSILEAELCTISLSHLQKQNSPEQRKKHILKKNRGNIKHTWVVNTIVTGENLNDLIRSALKQIYAFCGHSKLFHI